MLRKGRQIVVPLLLLAVVLACPGAHAGTPRILVVGDSWAAGIFGFEAFDKVLVAHGRDDVEVIGPTTAIGGSNAAQWAANHQGKLDAVAKALEDNPMIDVVHLSIGGNDLLDAAMKEKVCTLSPDERKVIWKRICADIKTLVDHILVQRPNVRVLLSAYDYLDPALMIKAFKMPFPEDVTRDNLNAAAIELAKRELEMVTKIDRCEFLHHYGVLQYHYGFLPDIEKKTVPLPGGPPTYKPFLGGNPEYANSPEAMPDGVHPVPKGYEYIIEHCFDVFYEDWLKEEPTK